MSETKEQIRTELIQELIEWNDEKIYFNKSWLTIDNKLKSMLPTETPEKIAERKAEEMLKNNELFLDNANGCGRKLILKMLIEALLTDIKK